MTATTYETQTAAVVAGTATIAAGESITEAIVLDSKTRLTLILPSLTSGEVLSGDATLLSFQVQAFDGGDWAEAADSNGNAISVYAGAGGFAPCPSEIAGAYAIKVRTGTATGPVVQTAERAIQFVAFAPFELTSPSPWNTEVFTKADVTAGGATAFTVANSPVSIFRVTGLVMMRIFAVIDQSITSTGGTGTLSVGVSGNVGTFLGTITANGTTKFQAGQVWAGTTNDSRAAPLIFSGQFQANNSGDVVVAIATNDMTAGGLTVYCQWFPAIEGSGATVEAL